MDDDRAETARQMIEYSRLMTMEYVRLIANSIAQIEEARRVIERSDDLRAAVARLLVGAGRRSKLDR